MPELAPPSSISDLRAQGIYAITARFGKLDLTPLLLYTITFAPDSALGWLAWQFDVADSLFQLIAPGADQRQLISQAVPLKKVVGTPFAIKTALATLGWPGAVIQEGQNSWGGTTFPSDQGWAVCRIVINLAPLNASDAAPWQNDVAYPAASLVSFNGSLFQSMGPAAAGTVPQFALIGDVPDVDMLSDVANLVQAPWQLVSDGTLNVPSAAQIALIVAAFFFFAPQRCWLDAVVLAFPPQSDVLMPAPHDVSGVFDMLRPAPSDKFTVNLVPQSDTYSTTPHYNRQYQHAGITYANIPVGPTDGASVLNGQPVEGNK
jgi:Phage tail protein (Tail_P2_I)